MELDQESLAVFMRSFSVCTGGFESVSGSHDFAGEEVGSDVDRGGEQDHLRSDSMEHDTDGS
jgi:hypothetical protein